MFVRCPNTTIFSTTLSSYHNYMQGRIMYFILKYVSCKYTKHNYSDIKCYIFHAFFLPRASHSKSYFLVHWNQVGNWNRQPISSLCNTLVFIFHKVRIFIIYLLCMFTDILNYPTSRTEDFKTNAILKVTILARIGNLCELLVHMDIKKYFVLLLLIFM